MLQPWSNKTTFTSGSGISTEAYGLPVLGEPGIADAMTNKLRLNLLQEELDELREALEQGNIVEALDALTDLQYVLDGAYLSFGLQALKKAAFDEVHRSNMMRKLGADGKLTAAPKTARS